MQRNNPNLEHRNTPASILQVRKGNNDGYILFGKIAYGKRSENLGGFYEVISPGAFTDSLRNGPEVLCYFSHDSNRILGRQSNNSLTLKDAPDALRFECVLNLDTSDGKDMQALLKRGDINANSFGFAVPDGDGDTWSQVGNDIVRTVNKALLYEVSPVGCPAYSANAAGLRNAPAAIRAALKRDSEQDEDSNEDEPCACTCAACSEDRACSRCTRSDCDSQQCTECPAQGVEDTGERSHLLLLTLQRRR